MIREFCLYWRLQHKLHLRLFQIWFTKTPTILFFKIKFISIIRAETAEREKRKKLITNLDFLLKVYPGDVMPTILRASL